MGTDCTGSNSFQKDKFQFNLIDMGGQRPERAKWDRVLGTVKGIFFFVSIEEYNVPSTEEKDKTKLDIALDTWKELLDNPKLASKSIILLLNKLDLMERKLGEDFSSFTDTFPEYKGKKTTEAATQYIREIFVNSVPPSIDLEYVSIFECCALDTDLMGKLWEESRTHIRNRALLSL